MEENRKKRGSKLNISVVLSFLVAFFGIFSIMSFGLATYGSHGGVSYAAPTGDSFTMYSPYKVYTYAAGSTSFSEYFNTLFLLDVVE